MKQSFTPKTTADSLGGMRPAQQSLIDSFYGPPSAAQKSDPFRANLKKHQAGADALDLYVDAHHHWLKLGILGPHVPTTMRPLANTRKECKSLNELSNVMRRIANTKPTAAQQLSRATARLACDGIKATLFYYGIDAERFDLPSEDEIIRLPYASIIAKMQAQSRILASSIIEKERPDWAQLPDSQRPIPRLQVGACQPASGRSSIQEEVYIEFFLAGRECDPTASLFCIPLAAGYARVYMGAVSHAEVDVEELPKTFAERGHLPFRHRDVGIFCPLKKDEFPALT